jgi:hypothetical protein
MLKFKGLATGGTNRMGERSHGRKRGATKAFERALVYAPGLDRAKHIRLLMAAMVQLGAKICQRNENTPENDMRDHVGSDARAHPVPNVCRHIVFDYLTPYVCTVSRAHDLHQPREVSDLLSAKGSSCSSSHVYNTERDRPNTSLPRLNYPSVSKRSEFSVGLDLCGSRPPPLGHPS